jgi:hypothetical protein
MKNVDVPVACNVRNIFQEMEQHEIKLMQNVATGICEEVARVDNHKLK